MSSVFTGTQVVLLRHLEPPKHHDEEIDREQPHEDHLPEPEIARRPVISGDLRVAIEKAFSDFENVNPAQQNEDEANAEDDAQSKDGIRMLPGEREKFGHPGSFSAGDAGASGVARRADLRESLRCRRPS